ncbi:glycosyltransferase [uncultured Psychroserpens sp.]|uniref:glycosyltransferase n=1 Tax=uncultured Psychroserpens sp. TaxID=255436 RepID=UPI002624CA36|nr:glycosyltransferase [uncultured Psychroserpens sp.]
MNLKKRILIAPLNWGLGHATRCIPIINALITHNYEPIIASDGNALSLLKKEFPDLKAITLPSYDITYPKKGQHFKLKLLQSSPKLMKAIKAEKKATASIIEDYNIDGVISDNRLGVHNKNIPCVFITHQLQVLSGSTTWLSTKLHQKIIQRFHECWVPDNLGDINLSGVLGHTNMHEMPIKYIGPLSRFKKEILDIKYDVMVLLSGPEPQRTLLENKLLEDFKHFNGKVIFIRGVIEEDQYISEDNHMTIYNFMTTDALGKAINESDLVVCRSGYTSLMDLTKLSKKAFFIPTPGQFEQEYLAKRLTDLGYTPSCTQDDFNIEKLKSISEYKGLNAMDYEVNYKKLFSLFEGE